MHSLLSTNDYNISLKKDSTYILGVFIIWPFIAFIMALLTYKNKYSKWCVLFFYILYGFTIIIPSETYDAASNVQKLERFADLPWDYFFEIFSNLYNSYSSLDFILPSIIFLVSRITNEHSLLFGIYAFIFGYISLKSINIFYNIYIEKQNITYWSYLFLFILTITIVDIGNFRFFTAVWIFFYGTFNVLYLKNKKYLWLSFFAAFLHFSLLAANILLLLYLLLGNKNYLYYVVILFSFSVSGIAGDLILQYSNLLGVGFQEKSEMYLHPNYVERIESTQKAWFYTWDEILRKSLIFIIYFMTRINRRKFNIEKNLENIFSFSLLLFALSIFTRSVPSLSGRYFLIFSLFALSYIFIVLIRSKNTNKVFYGMLAFIPLSLHFLIKFRIGLETMNYWLFAPNPLPFIGPPTSLYDLFMK